MSSANNNDSDSDNNETTIEMCGSFPVVVTAGPPTKKAKTETIIPEQNPPLPTTTSLFGGTSHDFYVPLIMQYLDTKSLVQFAETSKGVHDYQLPLEVARRKQLVEDYEGRIGELVGVVSERTILDMIEDRTTFTREAVLQAKKLQCKAWQLASGSDDDFEEDAVLTKDLTDLDPSHPFHEELRKFVVPHDHNPPIAVLQARSRLAMLPFCFYCPKNGEPVDRSSCFYCPKNGEPVDRSSEFAEQTLRAFLMFSRELFHHSIGIYADDEVDTTPIAQPREILYYARLKPVLFMEEFRKYARLFACQACSHIRFGFFANVIDAVEEAVFEIKKTTGIDEDDE